MQAVPIVLHGKAHHLDQSLTDAASNVCIHLSQQADVCRMLLNNASLKIAILCLVQLVPVRNQVSFWV